MTAPTVGEIGLMLRESCTAEKLTEAEARRLLALGGLAIARIPDIYAMYRLEVENIKERLHELLGDKYDPTT